MIGTGYWATGITVAWQYSGMDQYGWAASVDYLDDGFCDDDADKGQVSTEGTLRTRYAVRPGDSSDALTVVIDTLKADAERLGIEWRGPSLYYKGDGGHEEYPPPLGWRELLRAHAIRLRWRTYDYEPEAPLALEGGADDEIEAPRGDEDCTCYDDSCPCEADGPDDLCACCRRGECNGSCWFPKPVQGAQS